MLEFDDGVQYSRNISHEKKFHENGQVKIDQNVPQSDNKSVQK